MPPACNPLERVMTPSDARPFGSAIKFADQLDIVEAQIALSQATIKAQGAVIDGLWSRGEERVRLKRIGRTLRRRLSCITSSAKG